MRFIFTIFSRTPGNPMNTDKYRCEHMFKLFHQELDYKGKGVRIHDLINYQRTILIRNNNCGLDGTGMQCHIGHKSWHVTKLGVSCGASGISIEIIGAVSWLQSITAVPRFWSTINNLSNN